MNETLTELSWLPPPPGDFREWLKEISGPDPNSRLLARRLAATRLNGARLHHLGRAITGITSADSGAIRLGILSNGTIDLLAPALAASALRYDIWTHVINTTFDQVSTEALDPGSTINRANCHFVLVCLDQRGLPLKTAPGDPEGAAANVELVLQYIESICRGLRANSGCTVIIQTVPQVASSLGGSLDRQLPGTQQWLIDQVNRELRARINSSPDLLLDAAGLAEIVGLTRWHDPRQWALGKFSFAEVVVPLFADWAARVLSAALGKTRKCLVLDLDNTLWGGVIGDDGVAGIVLGQGDPAGEAFLKIQQTALELRQRGVVLAISSKNDDAIARSAFRSHPEMLLKETHIAIFQANWHDKASNLKVIAESLSIGLDTLVLLDDNPAERAQVRDALPMVAVPELPEDPAYFSDTLLAAGYFEAIRFTEEDRQRAEQYQLNAIRAKELSAVTDVESYLHSLQMQAVITPFDRIGRGRIAQLINKTNQFNLTTRRYTESQVEQFEQRTSGLTLQVRLTDRFGDNGVIAVVICEERQLEWIIDTWLMSCRVLNRRVEHVMLNYIVDCARAASIRALIGRYIRNQRNALVMDHYAKLGFSLISEGETESWWQMPVVEYVPWATPINLVVAKPFIPLERRGPPECAS